MSFVFGSYQQNIASYQVTEWQLLIVIASSIGRNKHVVTKISCIISFRLYLYWIVCQLKNPYVYTSNPELYRELLLHGEFKISLVCRSFTIRTVYHSVTMYKCIHFVRMHADALDIYFQCVSLQMSNEPLLQFYVHTINE